MVKSKSGIVFCFALALHIAAAVLFVQGFLLTRYEVAEKSSCEAVPGERIGICDEPIPPFRRAIIVVIDALRYDFVEWKEDNNNEAKQRNSSHEPASNFRGHEDLILLDRFRNKLPSIHNVLTESPDRAVLLPCWADPPTTTMQRLKALTTGSLPTFIDVSLNFNSPEILEDNLIHQFRQRSKKIAFMGDDTWISLFPNHFDRSFPYPSFNVKDLHTVDSGVITHLFPELEAAATSSSSSSSSSNERADVIIAHFLGVDHVGHTFGPQHHTMSDKLAQLDAVLYKVMKQMDNESVLIVFGDHGMTWDGNHGGASEDEVRAALFAYSPHRPLSIRHHHQHSHSHNNNNNNSIHDDAESVAQKGNPNEGIDHRRVSQVDIVPTLALLLGVPIPFANLGTFISDFIPQDVVGGAAAFSTRALRTNAWQVARYLTAYSALASDFSDDRMKNLRQKFEQANSMFSQIPPNASWETDSLREANRLYREYLDGVLEMCRSVWARFDEGAMLDGAIALSIMAVTVFVVSWIFPNGLQFGLPLLPIAASLLGALLFSLAREKIQLAETAGREDAESQGIVLGKQKTEIRMDSVGHLLSMLGVASGTRWGVIIFHSSIFVSFALLFYAIRLRNSFGRNTTKWSSSKSSNLLSPSSSSTFTPTRWPDSFFSSLINIFPVIALAARFSMLFSNSFIEAEASSLSFFLVTAFLLAIRSGFAVGNGPAMLWGVIGMIVVNGMKRFACASDGFAIQEYSFWMQFLLGPFVVSVILPLTIINISFRDELWPRSSKLLLFLEYGAIGLSWSGTLFWGGTPPAFFRIYLPRVAMIVCVIGVYLTAASRLPLPAVVRNRLKEEQEEGKRKGNNSSLSPCSKLFAFIGGLITLLGGSGIAVVMLGLVLFVKSVTECEWAVQDHLHHHHHHPYPYQSNSSSQEEDSSERKVCSSSTGRNISTGLSVWATVMLCLGSTFFFYATGHDTKVSRLRISAAFVGFENFEFFLSGSFLMLDTFGAEILCGVLGSIYVAKSHRRNPAIPLRQVLSFYLLVASLSAVFVGIQRRHLMVWAIFAPKFAFDLTGMVVIELAVLFALFLVSGKSTKQNSEEKFGHSQ